MAKIGDSLRDDGVSTSLLLTEQGSDPATPASGYGRLFAKSDGLYFIDDAGTVTGPLGSGGVVGGGTTALVVALTDEDTDLATGVAVVTFRMPYAMTLTAVRASLTASSSSGTPTFDINEGGTTILSTPITVDAGEKTSTTAATPPVISDTALADDAEITVDIDVAGTGATGAKVYLIGTVA